jgi:hypothetical protein
MTRDTFLGYLRTVMNIIGSLIVGSVIAGHAITNEVLEVVIGGGLSVAATIWGIVDKTAGLEQITSAISKVITFAGGLLVSSGFLKDNTLQAVTGLVPLLADEINKRIHSKKDENIATGKLGVEDLKAATIVEKKGEEVAPVVTTPIVTTPSK